MKKKYWLKKFFSDPYFKKKNINNVRSRAWFKLQELDITYKIFKIGMYVIDLGSSPGSWSQYACTKVGKFGKIIACDILPMKHINGVYFIQGNILEKKIFQQILSISKNKLCDVIMSDMSPNLSGFSFVDNKKSFDLSDVALKISKRCLSKKGFFIIKLFQGDGFSKYLKKISTIFNNVRVCKPNASRQNSREVFIIAFRR